jgi:hypothetical protein
MSANKTFQQKGDRGRLLGESDESNACAAPLIKRMAIEIELSRSCLSRAYHIDDATAIRVEMATSYARTNNRYRDVEPVEPRLRAALIGGTRQNLSGLDSDGPTDVR